ncbi:MAG: 1-acyl-sn-glycerol-3-phosphate acyltransferase, partial [Lachnospiraceae bacterium]|nr:1-acyl-sn-glycerol-3-phosphate acyltransferase [Lachnospiraceae bacterium]
LFLFLFLVLSMPYVLYLKLLGKSKPYEAAVKSQNAARCGFKAILFLSGVKLSVTGEEKIPGDRAVVYMANHRSFFDIVVASSRFVRPTGFLAKQELSKVPLLAAWMRIIHCKFIDRSSLKQGLKVIHECADEVKNGISICIFPEGTRSKGKEGELLEFHDASFQVALKSGAPIVPIAIKNSRSCFEAQFPWVKSSDVSIEFGAPIETSGIDRSQKKEIIVRTRAAIEEMLK